MCHVSFLVKHSLMILVWDLKVNGPKNGLENCGDVGPSLLTLRHCPSMTASVLPLTCVLMVSSWRRSQRSTRPAV